MYNPLKHRQANGAGWRNGPRGETRAWATRRLRAFHLTLAMCVFVCLASTALPAHSDTPSSGDSDRRRIAEKKEEGVGKKIVLFPFRAVGKGIESGFLAVEENNLVAKSAYLSERLTRKHVEILFGVGYDGAGLGGGVRWSPPVGAVTPTFSAAASVYLYQVYGLGLDFSRVLSRKIDLYADARYMYLPQEDFYGIGPDSSPEDRTNYKLEQTEVTLDLGRTLSGKIRFDADCRYTNTNIFSGDDTELPSSEDVFPPGTVPGLYTGAELLATTLSLSFLGLDFQNDPTSGVYAKMLLGVSEDLGGDAFDYWRASFEFRWAVALLGRGERFGARSTLVVRVLAEVNEPRNGGAVPFFNMPRLGGSTTLRGFREFRFTDENAALFNVEYRYPIQSLLDAVIFWDEGQVFPDPGDFQFGHFRSSFGGGLRMVHRHNMSIRLEVAKSSEAWAWIFKFGGAF